MESVIGPVIAIALGVAGLVACVLLKMWYVYRELTKVDEPEPGKAYWSGP